MNSFIVLLMVLSSMFTNLIYAEVSSDYVKAHSEQVEKNIVPLVKERFSQLTNKTENTQQINFSNGLMYINAEGLTWKSSSGYTTVLVSNSSLEEGYSLSGFVISPDSTKVAYNTTYHGQDLKFWNVVTVSQQPKILMKNTAENRMSEFTWNKKSDGFYYSYFNPKELVNSGKKPIAETRFRNVITGLDKVIFDHKLAENFGVQDLDGGNTLVAFRLLNPAAGIKTTFSLYKGVKNNDGNYVWTQAYPRNKFVGRYLGELNKKIYVLSGEAGDNYGVIEIDVIGNSRKTLVPAVANKVLHTADLVEDKLVLQYHTIPEQNVSLKIWDLFTDKKMEYSIGKDFNLTPFGYLSNFTFGPGGKKARASYSDVLKGNHAFELDLSKPQLSLLNNITELNFDDSQVKHELVNIVASDGTKLSGRLYSKIGEKPKFVYIRYYGWISIKNSPESKEVQMVLEAGGSYLTLDLPGGGERGQKWFYQGSRYRKNTFKYISEASTFLQNKLNMKAQQVVAMGRSWGGFTSMNLAATYGDNFGLINVVVPVINLEDMFANGWFGRIAHSDFAPFIDKNGNYILDEKFYNYVYSMSPDRIIKNIGNNININLFTNGLDDRVDQGGQQEADFAHAIEKKIGTSNFKYHRSVKGYHGSRFYQILMASLLIDQYKTTYTPLLK